MAWFVVLKPEPTDKAQAVCVILVDRTKSSDGPDRMSRYRNLGEGAVESCAAKKAVVSIYYFSNENSKLLAPAEDQPVKLYVHDIKNAGEGEKESLRRISSAKGILSTVLNQPSGKGRLSDIVTSMKLVGAEMDGMENTVEEEEDIEIKDRYLIILTDGIQNSGSVDMRPWLREAAPDPATLVQAAQSVGSLPELDGVEVAFAGVGDGDQREPDKEALIESFWRALVIAGGGETCAYAPSTTDAGMVLGGC